MPWERDKGTDNFPYVVLPGCHLLTHRGTTGICHLSSLLIALVHTRHGAGFVNNPLIPVCELMHIKKKSSLEL